jgi:hypothetical protein
MDHNPKTILSHGPSSRLTHIAKLLAQYANPKIAARLRNECANATTPAPGPADEHLAGNMVFDSDVPFMDMSLRLKNFVEAIQCGASNRIVTILKTQLLAFQGTCHKKYAYKMVVFFHNYLHVWPVPVRYVLSGTSMCNLIAHFLLQSLAMLS